MRSPGKLSGLAPTIEDLSKNGQEEQAAREDEENEDRNEFSDAPEVTPDLPPFLGGPWLAGIADLHEEAHESLYHKDMRQDEVPLAGQAALEELYQHSAGVLSCNCPHTLY
jgi:hypothetical protein